MNIIVNAETEMKQAHGRGKLTIKTEQTGNTIRVSFKDDGPGIAKENIGRVFDPFFTTKEVGEGTGLGLSLSHSIITEHKGALYVKSTPGKGATFIIELPIVAEEEEEIEKVEAVEETGKTSGGRILVVDDEPAIPAFLKRVLGGEGYEVTTVSSGEEALDRIESEEYGLILCDIKMPGLSGIEIYEQIEKVASSLQKRVIFITGDVMSADTREFLKRTKVPYVTKPFDIAKLKEEVKRVIAGAGQS
jgi:CheY-like chemotaxis protein